MKRSDAIALLSLGTFMLITASSLQAADRMKSGQWESSVIYGGQTSTNVHCITPEQAKSANGSIEDIRASLEKSAASLHCTLQDFKMDNNSLSYEYSCPGKSTRSKTSYHDGNTYETLVTSKDGSEEHTSQFKGRRLGDCP